MDNLDKKINKMIDGERWEIPQHIDERINNELDKLDSKSDSRRRPIRVAMLVFAILTVTVSSGFAIESIIDYFKVNKDSAYVSSKVELEKLGSSINLSAADKGIELTIDSVSTDDNYLNIFYTIKSDKNIKEINKDYKNPFYAIPYIGVDINGKFVEETSTSMPEIEAIYTSDNELKGMRRVNVTRENIKDNFNIKVYTYEVLKQRGNWSISTKINKLKLTGDSKRYDINKDIVINMTNNKNKKISHKINISKIILSPLGSEIVINEKVESKEDGPLIIGSSFALFSEEGRSLDVIDKGITWNTSNGISNNTYEFLKASKDMKSVTLVPIDSKNKKEYVKDYMMEPKVIGNFPIEFKPSEYGSLIIEDIKVSDKEIRYTYYKDGIVRYNPYLFFFDENGKEITHNSDGNVQESINRHTGRYTTVFKFKDGEFKSSNIKKVSFYTDKNIRLLYDKKVKIDL